MRVALVLLLIVQGLAIILDDIGSKKDEEEDI